MAKETDRISAIYDNSSVLVTGGTGFIGKVLIEKLLRSTNVKTIYMLIREKREKLPQQRMNEYFNNNLFDLLKKQNPNAFKKCKFISGDVTLINLGISESDQKLLQNEVNYIFHCAASVKFDDTMKFAVAINTRGTKFMLDLAQQCKKLKLFIHVSSAYAFPLEDILYERFYEPPTDAHKFMKELENTEEETEADTKRLLGKLPNTYTYSKALAEKLVEEQVGKLPIIITRLGLVVPIWKDPLPGWINNLQGPTGLLVAGGKGVLRSMFMAKNDAAANLLAADIAINAMLICSWDYFNKRKKDPIYHVCATKDDFQMSWTSIIKLGQDIINKDIPFNGILWYPNGGLTSSRFYYNFNFIFFHIIPALIIDALLLVLGYKPLLFQIQMRIRKGGVMFEYYTTKPWLFDTTSALQLRKLINSTEKERYQIDDEGFVLRDYFINCMKSARIYLKETEDMLPAARRNMKIMYFVDKICKALIIGGLLFLLIGILFDRK